MRILSFIAISLLLQFAAAVGFAQTDQQLEWFTYFGGSGNEFTKEIRQLDTEFFLSTGYTDSNTGIATTGSFQPVYGGGDTDAFVAKWHMNGQLEWATYLGGSNFDLGYSLDVLTNGNIVIAGETNSDNIFGTENAHQENLGAVGSAFLTLLSSSGDLVWSTYFGEFELGNKVRVDSQNDIYLIGTAFSTELSTPSSHQQIHAGSSDIFIAKFNESGVLQWCTYFGTASEESALDAVVDGDDNLVILGQTFATEGMATPGAETEIANGPTCQFISKFNSTGNLIWSTYISGNGNVLESSLGLMNGNQILVTGTTNSTEGFATPGSHSQINIPASLFPGSSTAYLGIYDAVGSKIWATYFGDLLAGFPDAVVSYDGHIYLGLSGAGGGGNNLYGQNPFQSSSNGNADFMLVRFDQNGDVVWSTFFGGTSLEDHIRLISNENGLIVAGLTWSTQFYSTASSFQPVYGGGDNDTFYARLTDAVLSSADKTSPLKPLRVWPNPANGSVFIRWNEYSSATAEIKIYSVNGQLIVYSNAHKNGDLLTLELNSGMYTVVARTKSGIYHSKLIITK